MFTDLLTALIIATLIMLPFYFLGRVGPWKGWLWFALVLFLFTWAGGAWVGPYGSTAWGFSWLPFLFFGLIFAFLMAAAVPPRPPRTRREAIEQAQAKREGETITALSLGFFFWILMAGLIAALVVHYLK
ncbi:MAG: hypothetical protein HQ561_10855 [Desulfobacteraceae bacterium]|nr:hypothetical protein [Desulfobacteraceae bacterium]